MSIINNLKSKIKENEEIEAFVHYIYDIDKWESRLIPLPKIKPLLELKSKNELYKLEKIAYYLNGKPVFLLVRGIAFSLELEKLENTLRIKGYSADEIQAKLNSIYVNSIFRKGSLQFKDYLVLILTNIIVALTTYIITYFSVMSSSIGASAPPISNSTIPGV